MHRDTVRDGCGLWLAVRPYAFRDCGPSDFARPFQLTANPYPFVKLVARVGEAGAFREDTLRVVARPNAESGANGVRLEPLATIPARAGRPQVESHGAGMVARGGIEPPTRGFSVGQE
jgi:hypothetical protein